MEVLLPLRFAAAGEWCTLGQDQHLCRGEFVSPKATSVFERALSPRTILATALQPPRIGAADALYRAHASQARPSFHHLYAYCANDDPYISRYETYILELPDAVIDILKQERALGERSALNWARVFSKLSAHKGYEPSLYVTLQPRIAWILVNSDFGAQAQLLSTLQHYRIPLAAETIPLFLLGIDHPPLLLPLDHEDRLYWESHKLCITLRLRILLALYQNNTTDFGDYLVDSGCLDRMITLLSNRDEFVRCTAFSVLQALRSNKGVWEKMPAPSKQNLIQSLAHFALWRVKPAGPKKMPVEAELAQPENILDFLSVAVSLAKANVEINESLARTLSDVLSHVKEAPEKALTLLTSICGEVEGWRFLCSDVRLVSTLFALFTDPDTLTQHKELASRLFRRLKPWKHDTVREFCLQNIANLYSYARDQEFIFHRCRILPSPDVDKYSSKGNVHAVTWKNQKGQFVVKEFRAIKGDEFYIELTMLSFMSHENIVSCYGGCTQRGLFNSLVGVIVLEKMDMDLVELIDQLQTNRDKIVLHGDAQELKFDLARQLISALIYLHHYDICHRDVKSLNVMVKRQPSEPLGWRLKLIDVGVSRVVDARSTCSAEFLSTYYTPLEVKQRSRSKNSRRKLDTAENAKFRTEGRLKGDIYGFGWVISELWLEGIHRRPPQPEEDGVVAMDTTALPPKVHALIVWCLKEDWTKRPKAEEALALLNEAEEDYKASKK